MDIKIHPAANLFPKTSEAEYQTLKADIAVNGLQTSIQCRGNSHDDCELVDGRNRLRAIRELGLDESCYIELIAPGDMPDPVAYVVSLNLHRRHLTTDQRAMVAANIANLKDGQKKCAASIEAPASQSDAADMMNVSRSSVQRAAKVLSQAIPELIDSVEQNEVSVSAAAEVAKLDHDEQRQVIGRGAQAVRDKATDLRNATGDVVSGGSPAVRGPMSEDQDSDKLWKLKCAWGRASRKDKKAFREFVAGDLPVIKEENSKAMKAASDAFKIIWKISLLDPRRQEAFKWIYDQVADVATGASPERARVEIDAPPEIGGAK